MHGDEATSLTQKRYDRQAGLFDFVEAPIETLAFKRLRKRLWSEVHGARILEVGVGTGKNLSHHPEGSRRVAIDLSPGMLRHAVRKADRLGRDVDLVLADAQRLPFRDGAFDAAAATFVFCSVPDPVLGLREVRRVLRQEGSVHLMEHVRSRNPIMGKLMDLVNPVAVRLMGANINRDTVGNVEKAGFALKGVQSRGFGIFKLIRGNVLQTGGAGPEAVSDVALG